MDRDQQILIQILERDCRDVAEQKAALKNRARPALGIQVARQVAQQFQLLQAMVLKHVGWAAKTRAGTPPILAESKELTGINKSSG